MMQPAHTTRSSNAAAIGVALALALTCHLVLEAVDVKVEHDKTFNFKTVRTWAWNTPAPGDVRMARTQQDDPEAMKARLEPVLMDAVTAEMTRLGLQPATSAPDVTVRYFVLLTTGTSAQTLGQFLPATTSWGLPPFAPATQSLQVMNTGSLVLDLSANGVVIWRGVAQAQIKPGLEDKKREAIVREAIRDLLRRYPR